MVYLENSHRMLKESIDQDLGIFDHISETSSISDVGSDVDTIESFKKAQMPEGFEIGPCGGSQC